MSILENVSSMFVLPCSVRGAMTRLLSAIFLFCTMTTTATASTMQMTPAVSSVAVGEIFAVDVVVDSQSAALVVVDAILQYPPADLEVVAIDLGGSDFAFDFGLTPGTFPIVNIDAISGSTQLVVARPTPGVIGGALTVARIYFKALATNSSSITFLYSGAGLGGDSNAVLDDGSGTDSLNGVTDMFFSISSLAAVDGDSDGISDNYETRYGGNLDPAADGDNDGVTNLEEYLQGTDPTSADTDGDGVNDRIDPDPLDPLVATTGFGDFDGDALADVVLRNNSNGQNYLWMLDGPTILVGTDLRRINDTRWRAAAIGDFDGDKKADILWHNNGTGQFYVWFMDGATITSEGPIRTIRDTRWSVVGAGDYNGDGKSDVLMRHSGNGSTYMWLLDGQTIIGEGTPRVVADKRWEIVASGDYNGDGMSDIYLHHNLTGDNYMWLMNGLSIVSSGYQRRLPDTRWKVAASGDYDGDGRSDIFLRHDDTGQHYVWLMNGASIVGEGWSNTLADTNWYIAGSLDYNGDGKDDILLHHRVTGSHYMWMMDSNNVAGEGPVRNVPDTNWAPVYVSR